MVKAVGVYFVNVLLRVFTQMVQAPADCLFSDLGNR